MRKTLVVDSQQTLDEAIQILTDSWNEFHYGRVEFFFGNKRSAGQNAMNYQQYGMIGNQLYAGDIKQAKRECKLNIGVPILLAENTEFARGFDKVVAPHNYQTQLQMMDYFPVTSEMTIGQGRQYTKTIFDTYGEQGIDWQGIDLDKMAIAENR